MQATYQGYPSHVLQVGKQRGSMIQAETIIVRVSFISFPYSVIKSMMGNRSQAIWKSVDA